MDQLRTALAWLKRHHFWVLSVLAALIGVGCWWSASGKLDKLFGANKGTIQGAFTSVQNIQKEPFHANEDVNTKQSAQTKQQAEGVAKLWQQLYDRQRAGVLKWPVPPLSKEFGDAVEKLQFGADIRPELRNNYQNYVDGHFPELPKQIDARPIEANEVASGGPGGGFGRGRFEGMGPVAMSTDSSQDETDFVCEWNQADQAFVRDQMDFRQQPSSLRIWVTQEDLWVYHTLLDVIAKTNHAANATRMSNAAVKSVYELAVGQRAAKYSRTIGRLLFPPPTATPTGGPGEAGPGGAPGGAVMGPEGGPGGRGGFSPEMMPGGGPGGGQMTEEQERTVLLYGRYLGPDGKPIPFGSAGGVGEAGPGAAPAPDPAAAAAPAGPLDLTVFGQEYKRLPVRMVLRMDQRWLPRLVAECASEPLQVEVQEVRINVPEAGSTEGGGPGGGGFRGFSEGGPGGGGARPSITTEETGVMPFPSHPEIVNVIIQGTIYIFNKPNPTILQPQGEQQSPQVASSNGGQ